jgi:hypothetical protein
MLRRVALVRTDVSEELSASIVRVTRIGKLGNIPEDAILHGHRRKNLRSYGAGERRQTPSLLGPLETLCFLVFRIPDDVQRPEPQ